MLHFGAEAFCAAWSVCSEKSRRCRAESVGGVSRLGTSSCPCVTARSAGKVCVTCLLASVLTAAGLPPRPARADCVCARPLGHRRCLHQEASGSSLHFTRSDHEIAGDPLVQPYKHMSVRGDFRKALCKILSPQLTLYYIYPYIIY